MNHGFWGRTQLLREAGPGEGACGRGEALACEPGQLLDGTTNRGPAVSVKGQGDRLGGPPCPYLLCPGSHVTNQWPCGLNPVSAKVPETGDIPDVQEPKSSH